MFYVSLTLEIKNEKIMWNIKWALRSDDGNDFQSLIETFWGFLSQAKMEQCFQKEKKKNPEAIVKGFSKTVQRYNSSTSRT